MALHMQTLSTKMPVLSWWLLAGPEVICTASCSEGLGFFGVVFECPAPQQNCSTILAVLGMVVLMQSDVP